MKHIDEIKWIRNSFQQVSFDPSLDSDGTENSPATKTTPLGNSNTHKMGPIDGVTECKGQKKCNQSKMSGILERKCQCKQNCNKPREQKLDNQANGSDKPNRQQHPLDAANLFSKLFFSWMFPFIWRGWRIGLKSSDVSLNPSLDEHCYEIGAKLATNWRRELEACNWRPNTSGRNKLFNGTECGQELKQPSLVKAVIKTHAKWILLNSLLTFFAEVVCKSLSTYSVGQMLLYMNSRELVENLPETTTGFIWSLYQDPLMFWTMSLIFASCCWVMTAHYYGFQMMRVGLHLRVGCSYLIYKKSLGLGQYESTQATVGRMINLLSNDLDKFNFVCMMIPFLWIGPMQTLVSIWLLWPLLGPSCLGALLILSILTPMQLYLSRKFASYRHRIASCTDERVRLLNETISSLKLIKFYAWEMPFRARLFESRRKETNLINRVAIMKGISVALMYVSSKMVLFVTIIFHCLLFDQILDAKTLFMAMAMLNNVQFTMTQLIPRFISLGVESLVSLRRIADFLLTKEFEPSSNLWLEPVLYHESKQKHQHFVSRTSSDDKLSPIEQMDFKKLTPRGWHNESTKKCPFVHCQNIGARWPKAEIKTLEGISFRCEGPGLIIICGQVASGKSSFLMSLLNELPISEGTARVSGKLGYSSQTAWIFNGTVRENIVFGHEYNEERYKQTVEVCALVHDFELFEHGDLTYIQEESLSGGQKARLNLARCLYRDCDIYLLDDPFSAIDGRVSTHIFEEAIIKFLAGKLVFLATHQVKFLKRVDKILLLDQGKQLAFCEYTKLGSMLFAPAGEHFTRKQLERLAFLKRAFMDTDEIQWDNNKVTPKVGDIRQDDKRAMSQSMMTNRAESAADPTDLMGPQHESQQEDRRRATNELPSNGQALDLLVEQDRDLLAGETKQIDEELIIQQLFKFEEEESSSEQQDDDANICDSISRSRTIDNHRSRSSSVHDSSSIGMYIDSRLTFVTKQLDETDINEFQLEKSDKKQPTLEKGTVSDEYQPREENNGSQNGPTNEEDSSSASNGDNLHVWFKYYTQNSFITPILIILTFLITQSLFSTVDIYLTVWSMIEQNRVLLTEISNSNQRWAHNVKHQTFIDQKYDIGNKHWPTRNITNIISYDSNAFGGLGQESKPFPCIADIPNSSDNYDSSSNNTRTSPFSSQSGYGYPLVVQINKFFSPMIGWLSYNYQTDSIASNFSSNNSQQQVSNQTVFIETIPIVVDGDILLESEAALSIKSIYRPLYLLVNDLTSTQHVAIYTVLLATLFVCSAVTNVISLTSSNKSAITLYRKLTDSALFAKMAVFDQNPIGRFLNRATRDFGIIDEAIPYNANQAYDALLQTAATFIVVILVDIKLAPPSLVILFIFIIFHSIQVKSTKDIQRLEGISRSPILTHVSTTLAGLHTIRATKSEYRLEQLFMKYQDAHTSVFLLKLGSNRSTAVILDWFNAIYIAIIALTAVLTELGGPSAGLIITSAILLSGLTQHGVMKLTETESLMTSVERVLEYCDLPQEESYSKRGYRRPNSVISGGDKVVWPCDGCIEYRNVDLYYNKWVNKPVLKNISFKSRPGEKIGVIGRTGAGKSSIIATLFRLYDFEGSILIDGIDIKTLNLIELRTSISIIPQNPTLFSMSIRENLDPQNVHDDFTLWSALDKAHLRETISSLPGKLDYNIGDGCFSSGQMQLMCLARVLLRKNKIIVIDEATANVDPTTDAIIQTTIRREFKHCTIIVIAHRLETIVDCDRIMVLDAGRIVDFDTPERLANKSNSYFANLMHESNSNVS